MGRRILVATTNTGKLKEIRRILGGLDIELVGLSDIPSPPEVIEDGETLLDNALKKAEVMAGYSGLPSLADDTGLLVDYLDDRPGVRTARFAGLPQDDAKNRRKLLEMLAGVPREERTARFKTLAALVFPSGETVVASGVCEGIIAESEQGQAGFGYDPVFIPEGEQRTFAEMTRQEKNEISHRGRALRKLAEILYARPELFEENDG